MWKPFKCLTLRFGVFGEPLARVKYLVLPLIFLPRHWWGQRINLIEMWWLVRGGRSQGLTAVVIKARSRPAHHSIRITPAFPIRCEVALMQKCSSSLLYRHFHCDSECKLVSLSNPTESAKWEGRDVAGGGISALSGWHASTKADKKKKSTHLAHSQGRALMVNDEIKAEHHVRLWSGRDNIAASRYMKH